MMELTEPRSIYSQSEREAILRGYTDRGWQLVRLRGYNRLLNPERVYQKGKAPADSGWPGIRVSLSEAIDWMNAEGWIGLVVPPGYVALDIDDPAAVEWLRLNADPKWTISRTKNGFHVLFRLGETQISGASAMSMAGVKITYRAAGKNQIVVAPTPCREWVQWFPDEIPQIPEILLPVPQTAGDSLQRALDVVKKLFQAPSGEKHFGRLKGARLLGGLIAGGVLSEKDPVVEDLIRLGVANSSDPRSAEKTIRDGINYGKAVPIRDVNGYAAGLRRPEGDDVIEGPGRKRSAADVAVDVAYFLADHGWFRCGEQIYYTDNGKLVCIPSVQAPEWRIALNAIRWWDEKKGFGKALSPGVLDCAWLAALHVLPERETIGGPGVYGGRVILKTDSKHYIDGGTWERADCTPEKSASWLFDEVFFDFAWGKFDDFLRAMAELFSGFLVGHISGPLPMFLHHAATPGAGKTLLAEVIGTIIDGSPSRFSGDSDDIERGKRIFGMLARGARFAYVDNQKEKFGGQMWEALCTSRDFEERVMHTQTLRKVKNNCVWCITGNNVPITPDMARRLVIVDVDAHGQQRDISAFKHVPLLPWIAEHRKEIVGHILNILEAWCDAGCPVGNMAPQSFEEWGQVISGVVRFAYGNCPALIDRDGAALEHDYKTQAWLQIVHEWHNSPLGETPSTIASIADRLGHLPWDDIVPVQKYNTLEAAIKQALSRGVGQVFGGWRVCRDWHPRQMRYLYYVQKCEE